MKYLAYGSNLNKSQMSMRCPNAKPLGRILIPNFRLIFRGVADIEESHGSHCPMGVWEITERCEEALDIYEGFPHLYDKLFFKLDDEVAMTYVMTTNRISPPSRGYFNTIKEGYENFSLDTQFLYDARTSSYRESHYNIF
jgi:hypothetical protein